MRHIFRTVADFLRCRRHCNRSCSTGQIIIEAIVALSALTICFVGIFGLISTSLHYNRFIANDYTGTYLAAEGIEVVKNLLDSNVISGREWGCGFMNGSYELTYDTQFKSTVCSQSVLDPNQSRSLYMDSGSHLYNYNVAAAGTAFTRVVTIEVLESDSNGNPQEMQVNSVVSWNQGAGKQSVNLEDRFFNWHAQ